MPAPAPGSRVYKITKISLEDEGAKCRVTFAIGVVPVSGETKFGNDGASVEITGPELAAFRGAVAAKLLASPPACIAGATLLP